MVNRDDLVRHFARTRTQTLGYLRVLVRDPHLAEDLLQETWLVVMKKLDSFDEARDFDAWVRGIARNLVKNALRSSVRQAMHVTYVPSPELVEAIERVHETTPRDHSEVMEQKLQYLSDCVKQVSPANRPLLELRYKEGASIRDIARRMSRGEGAVQVALSRVRQFILRCMEERSGKESHVVQPA